MFNKRVIADAKKDALDRYPNESCGLVVGRKYVPLENVHEDPQNHFRIASEAWVDYPTVRAVIHSHTHAEAFDRRVVMPGLGLDAPSQSDMESQIATAVPWGIILTDGYAAKEPFWLGDHTLDEPLKERVFRHGVYDCYALARAYYWQTFSVKLPDFPRVDAWWDKGYNLFLDHFRDAGFRLLSENDQLEKHDACLASVMSPGAKRESVVNHCGMYTGNGKVLHHLYNRLSREDPLPPYRRFVRHWVRYDP